MKKLEILNEITLIDDWTSKRQEVNEPIRAYCTSPKCQGHEHDEKATGVLKKVSKQTVFCPDCSHALIWQKDSDVLKKTFNQRRRLT